MTARQEPGYGVGRAMFSVTSGGLHRTCAGYSRRDFLTIGACGFLGLSLPELLRTKALAAETGLPVKDRSVVLLFLSGGPPHIETFDPKMTAPTSYRSIFGEVPTVHPGVTFGGHFEKLARLADKFSVVRSYGSGNTKHRYQKVASANNSLGATFGSLYARVVGTNDAQTGMPSNVLVVPEAVSDLKLASNFETKALPGLTSPGSLGAPYRAFNVSGGGELRENMELQVSPARFADRRLLLQQLDRYRRMADGSGLAAVDRYRQQAFEVVSRGAAGAFDLSREDPRTIARYDTGHLFANKDVHRWGDMARGTNLLGKQMLLARRLCEAGCGFVTVSDCGWDFHSNQNSPKGLGGMKWLGPQLDHAVAAFIEDVEERGLSDKILLVVTGEMGRTPRINKGGGRDHYGELTPLLLYGGGLRMGQVVGESDDRAEVPATRPYDPSHLLATIFHTLFDLGEMRVRPPVPSTIAEVILGGTPIPELV